MRRPLRVPPAVLVTLVLAISILWAIGCSRDLSSITGPKDGGSQTATGLRLDSPAVMAAMVAQDRATPALLRQSGILGTGISADAAGKPVILVYTERAGMASIPKDIDGISILPTLVYQPDKQKQHDYLYWAFYEGNRAGQAVRMGDWKAIEQPKGSAIRLYDLKDDVGEKHDLAAEKPELVVKAKDIMARANTPSEKWKFPGISSPREH